MRIVVDTSILWKPGALSRLAHEAGDHVVPAVAYAERARQYAQTGRSIGQLDETLASFDLSVEAFTREFALRFVPRLTDDEDWKRLDRDAMIAGHVGPADVLWTANVKDFLAVGLREDQVVAV